MPRSEAVPLLSWEPTLKDAEERTVADRSAFRLATRMRSFRYAARGVRAVVQSQQNARIHLAASAAVGLAGAVVGLSRVEWCLVVGAIVAVWVAESLNTALEALCDVASPAMHPLVERAKDVAAGAVLITAVGAVIIGALVFGPRLIHLW
jgi:diacylglycerol kinase (ATP)